MKKTIEIGTPNLKDYKTFEKWLEENIGDQPHRIEILWFNPSALPHESQLKPFDYELIKGGDMLYMGRKNKEWKDRLVLDIGTEESCTTFELPLDQIKQIKFTLL